MRVISALAFLVLMLAGGALGIAYPWAVDNVVGYEIGRWSVYDPQSGFRTVEVWPSPAEAPVRATVELVARPPFVPGPAGAVMTLVVNVDGRTLVARAYDFVGEANRTLNPQTGEAAYRASPIVIDPVADSAYSFVFGPGEGGLDGVISAELIVNAGAFDLDPRAVPAGYVLMAIGFIGFVLSLRRRRSNPNDQPPPPRWGRN